MNFQVITANVVMKLLEERLNNAHSVYPDNLYNNLSLAKCLLAEKNIFNRYNTEC